jgi:hypothetical protein
MTPTFEQLGVWMVCALFALDIWIKLRATQKTEGPQKREVSLSTEFVRKSEVEIIGERLVHVEEHIDLIRDGIKKDRETLMIADEHRASKIHERINELSREFNDKIQALPNEVIVLLRNTGALQ